MALTTYYLKALLPTLKEGDLLLIGSSYAFPISVPLYDTSTDKEKWVFEFSETMQQCVLGSRREEMKYAVVCKKKPNGVVLLLVEYGHVWIEDSWPGVYVELLLS